jgi:hypothetical protein
MASDPLAVKRTWQTAMEPIIQTKHGTTLLRWKTAIKDKAFDLIRHIPLMETQGEHLLRVLEKGTVSTNGQGNRTWLRHGHNRKDGSANRRTAATRHQVRHKQGPRSVQVASVQAAVKVQTGGRGGTPKHRRAGLRIDIPAVRHPCPGKLPAAESVAPALVILNVVGRRPAQRDVEPRALQPNGLPPSTPDRFNSTAICPCGSTR